MRDTLLLLALLFFLIKTPSCSSTNWAGLEQFWVISVMKIIPFDTNFCLSAHNLKYANNDLLHEVHGLPKEEE